MRVRKEDTTIMTLSHQNTHIIEKRLKKKREPSFTIKHKHCEFFIEIYTNRNPFNVPQKLRAFASFSIWMDGGGVNYAAYLSPVTLWEAAWNRGGRTASTVYGAAPAAYIHPCTPDDDVNALSGMEAQWDWSVSVSFFLSFFPPALQDSGCVEQAALLKQGWAVDKRQGTVQLLLNTFLHPGGSKGAGYTFTNKDVYQDCFLLLTFCLVISFILSSWYQNNYQLQHISLLKSL